MQELIADLVHYLILSFLCLTSLLQELLPKPNICLLWCGAVYLEASMANNCVSLLRSSRTLWRASMTIVSVPMLKLQ